MPAELFASLAPTPLAERLRPKALGEILGQDHLLGPEGPLGRMLEARKLALRKEVQGFRFTPVASNAIAFFSLSLG